MRRASAFVLAVVLIVLVLCPAPGAAAPRPGVRPAWGAAAPGGTVIWSVLRAGFPGLAGFLAKIGISMDPNGGPLQVQPLPTDRKIGSRLDPDGQPLAGPQPTEPQTDIGIKMDPDGLAGH